MMNMKVRDNEKNVPLWEKFNLTITEAAEYFNIGEKKLRKLTDDNLDCGFAIYNGTKVLINRKKFEEFLNQISSI
ncbi:excisionase family DNA binding protein [Aequitasia blattaphilus]|uniref:DUF6462 family protein n=2 Tax=Lachnospiraceae TaxID=186803 RepID=A0ABT1ENN1_9FIRM|nr:MULTISPECIES: excisionase [Lachnospiraceae]MCP1101028.1 DUF6462 family protein [Aequitasia blattaphilus]MCP1111387.1 DUF6462 family protein [Ohessyouella blattaphilus]MCR8564781.1 DUF6462 family protein [Ohessyouella blattaphilus]MCR8613668.1 DUF6462 family protein [Aequitasia blattaphilus]